MVRSDSTLSITGSASNNLRFLGQYFLLESGLHYNWYRQEVMKWLRFGTASIPGERSMCVGSLMTSFSPVSCHGWSCCWFLSSLANALVYPSKMQIVDRSRLARTKKRAVLGRISGKSLISAYGWRWHQAQENARWLTGLPLPFALFCTRNRHYLRMVSRFHTEEHAIAATGANPAVIWRVRSSDKVAFGSTFEIVAIS
jgi:hypothetical protein